MNCEECAQLQKRIRVMLSDHEFELRKLNQDKAEQMALFELNTQKELRKWQQRYSKQKLEHEQNNKKWLNKIDETTAQYEVRLRQLKEMYELNLQNEKQSIKDTYERDAQSIRRQHELQIVQLKNNHEELLLSTQTTHRNETLALIEKYKNQMLNLNAEAQQKQESIKKDCQVKIFRLQLQKKAQEKQNIKLQQEHRKQRSKLLGEIYDLKVIINSLQQNIKLLKTNLKQKQQQIERNAEQINQLKQLSKKEKKATQDEILKIKKQWEAKVQNQKKLSLQRELQIANKYEASVKKIEQKRQYEHKNYLSNLSDVRSYIDNRPSKMEDVEQILVIKDRLSKKQKQYQCLQKQAKSYQLELQNKEDTYNRIFMPSVSSTHLNDSHYVKRKDIRLKRPGKSLSTVRDILIANLNTSQLPSLSNVDKKMVPPKSTKVL